MCLVVALSARRIEPTAYSELPRPLDHLSVFSHVYSMFSRARAEGAEVDSSAFYVQVRVTVAERIKWQSTTPLYYTMLAHKHAGAKT